VDLIEGDLRSAALQRSALLDARGAQQLVDVSFNVLFE
jgi:hypothetical protein